MRPNAVSFLMGALSLASFGSADCQPPANRPNIVLLMTDDQDLRLGSTDYQKILHSHVIDHGVEFSNHYATTANCCPSRASLLRGQMVHNTNITHVHAPGGNYDKFVYSGQDRDYLPIWMKQAGYNVECKWIASDFPEQGRR